MDSRSQQSRDALARFNKEIEALKGDDLLDRKIAFDRLPPALESERNLRRAQSYTLGAALLKAFGLGNWRKAVADRRDRAAGPEPPGSAKSAQPGKLSLS
jgi:hypothetical protein